MTLADFVINNDFIIRQPKNVQRIINTRSHKNFCRGKTSTQYYERVPVLSLYLSYMHSAYAM